MIYNREEILNKLSSSIDILDKKISNGRIKDHEKEKLKINQYKAMAYSCNVYNNILKDKQYDKLTADVESIKTALIEKEKKNTLNLETDLEIVNETLEKLGAIKP
ncbi:MAG: hypothetical protein KO202_00845 [Methanobacteriaceae archaeon]|jgi:viroplasmin and RNaseH domain-containing protein|nr:hypothetical protein [Methanobacteriaceae archaeon]